MASASSSDKSTLSFEQIFNIVKSNDKKHFDDVYRELLSKSDYLTTIPENDSCSMLHYIVMNGALDLFNRVIGIPNLRFILLTKTASKPSKNILQISEENQGKSATHKELYKTINRLDTLDRFVNYAKNSQLNECRKMLLQDPDLANLKPPYRKFFLIHHLAFDNKRSDFDQLSKECDFNMELLTNDKKTASEVALEENHKEFADYLESLSPKMRAKREEHERERQQRNTVAEERDTAITNKIVATGRKNLLPCLTCPLTREIFQDPVLLVADGQTYERAAIQKWLDLGNHRSPMTNVPLTDLTLVPNMVIKQVLNEFQAT